MALKQPGLISRAEAAATLVITARAKEGLRLRKVYVTNPSGTLQHVTLINDTARVGFFRIQGLGGRHLSGPNDASRGRNLLDFMTRFLNFPGYPIAEGESLTINVDNGTADIFALYDSFDSADIKADAPQGSHSGDVTFVNYGTNLAAIAATGYNKVDNRRNPAEMVGFPFGGVGAGLVPSLKKVDLLWVGGQAVARFVGAGATGQTQYLRLRQGSAPAQTLFDRADVGYPFFGTIPGAGVDYTSSRQVLPSSVDTGGFQSTTDEDVVVPQMTFGANDELAFQVLTNIVGAGNLAAGDIDVWAVMRVYSA